MKISTTVFLFIMFVIVLLFNVSCDSSPSQVMSLLVKDVPLVRRLFKHQHVKNIRILYEHLTGLYICIMCYPHRLFLMLRLSNATSMYYLLLPLQKQTRLVLLYYLMPLP